MVINLCYNFEKNGKLKICINFSKLNAATKRYLYPLSFTYEVLD